MTINKFQIRVLLHNVSDYAPLHAEMRKGGFRRNVRGSNLQWYEQLPGEYRYDTANDTTTDAVFMKAISCIEVLYKKKDYAIQVFGRNRRRWQGLKSVSTEASKLL